MNFKLSKVFCQYKDCVSKLLDIVFVLTKLFLQSI